MPRQDRRHCLANPNSDNKYKRIRVIEMMKDVTKTIKLSHFSHYECFDQ